MVVFKFVCVAFPLRKKSMHSLILFLALFDGKYLQFASFSLFFFAAGCAVISVSFKINNLLNNDII